MEPDNSNSSCYGNCDDGAHRHGSCDGGLNDLKYAEYTVLQEDPKWTLWQRFLMWLDRKLG